MGIRKETELNVGEQLNNTVSTKNTTVDEQLCKKSNSGIDLSHKQLKECRYACKEDEFAKVEFDFCITYDNDKYKSSKIKRENNNCINNMDYFEDWYTYINEYNDNSNEYIENSEFNMIYRESVNELIW